ncbi:MAG: zinc-ribbon domain-containing protein, partial [Desulfobacterales bacterium]
MIVICEECGKKYRIDPSKIKGKAASFKCRACTHVIMVSKPKSNVPPPDVAVSRPDMETAENRYVPPKSDVAPARPAVDKIITKPPREKRGLGIRAKMLLLFLFIPFLLMIGAGFLYYLQFEQMSALLTRESTNIVNRLAEEKIG